MKTDAAPIYTFTGMFPLSNDVVSQKLTKTYF